MTLDSSSLLMKLRDLPDQQFQESLKSKGLLLSVGPFTLRLGTTLPHLLEPLQLLYHDYDLVPDGGIVDFDLRVESQRRIWSCASPKAVFVVDGSQRFDPFDVGIALPMLEWGINWCTFTRPNHYLLLHSAVLERHGHAFMLPGPPGSGKSTLCAAMSLRGWRLLSDELAVMRPGTLDFVPVPRPICLKEQSIDVIRRFDSQAVLGPSCPGTRKGTVAHLRPPIDSITRAGETARTRWIIFPAYMPGSPTELYPISKAMTLLDLTEDAFNFSLLGTIAFETLADLIDQSECHELRYSNLEEAINLLARLADGTQIPDPSTAGYSCVNAL